MRLKEKKIRLPITEVLLCVAVGDLNGSKKKRNWQSLNAFLLPPFQTEVAILHGELDAGELLKIFAQSITEWTSDTAPPSEADEASDDDSVVTVEAPEASEGKKLGNKRPPPRRPPPRQEILERPSRLLLRRPQPRRYPPLQSIAMTS